MLLHGAFSNHRSNWSAVKLLLLPHFSVYAIARRGRGETEATTGHSIEDEIEDAVAFIRCINAPVFLLGHSYGAHVALVAAARVPDLVRKLVLYEAPWPTLCGARATPGAGPRRRLGGLRDGIFRRPALHADRRA